MKRARTEDAQASGLQLSGKVLPVVNFWAAMDFLSCGEVAGVHVTCKRLRAAVERYVEEGRETVEIGAEGSPGYNAQWEWSEHGSTHSVARLARRMKTLRVCGPGQSRLALRLIRANAATLQCFDAPRAPVQPYLMVALARCPHLEAFGVSEIAGEDAAWLEKKEAEIRRIQPYHSQYGHTYRSAADEAEEATIERARKKQLLTASVSVLLDGVGGRLRELVLPQLPAAQVSQLLQRGTAALPHLEVYAGNAPEDWSLFGGLPTLTDLRVAPLAPVGIAELTAFATAAAASLPGLEVLSLDITAAVRGQRNQRQQRQEMQMFHGGGVRAVRPGLTWSFPALRVFELSWVCPLRCLPPLEAPVLEELRARVGVKDVPDLMEGCPRLACLGTLPDTADGRDFTPFYESGLQAAATAHLLGRIQEASNDPNCRWSSSLQQLILHGPPLPVALVAALARACPRIAFLRLPVPATAPAILTRYLLERLPKLEELALDTAAAQGQHSARSSEEGVAASLVSRLLSSPPELEFSPSAAALSLPCLRYLSVSLLDERTLEGLTLPALERLELEGGRVREVNLAANVLPAAPNLRNLTLDGVGTLALSAEAQEDIRLHSSESPSSSSSPSSPTFSVAHLHLFDCPELTASDLHRLLLLLPGVSHLLISGCDQLPPATTLFVLAGLLRPLEGLRELKVEGRGKEGKEESEGLKGLAEEVMHSCPQLEEVAVNAMLVKRPEPPSTSSSSASAAVSSSSQVPPAASAGASSSSPR